MDLKKEHKRSRDQVLCPRTRKKVSVITCSTCPFLSIILSEVVKCGYSHLKECYENGELIIDCSGDVRNTPI